MKKKYITKILVGLLLAYTFGVAVFISAVYAELPVPAEFDWRDKHQARNPASPYFDPPQDGQQPNGWLTNIEHQHACNNCQIFGTYGAIEGIINAYYNRHVNVLLSAQDFMTCSPQTAACAYMGGEEFDHYLITMGAPDVECLPYLACDGNADYMCDICEEAIACREQCVNSAARVADKRWRITGRSEMPRSIYDIKKEIFYNGPLYYLSTRNTHYMTAVGYGVEDGEFHITFKNLRGEEWGEHGYVSIPFSEEKLFTPNDNPKYEGMYDYRYNFYKIEQPVIASPAFDEEVHCFDRDCDGYCNWGIGERPDDCGDNSQQCVADFVGVNCCPSHCNEYEFSDTDDTNDQETQVEDCELPGDDDGNGLADCADVSHCPEGVFCDRDHARHCNSNQQCQPPEICAQPGDEDFDGLLNCSDVNDCPEGSVCGVGVGGVELFCNSDRLCALPEDCTVAGDEDWDDVSDCKDTTSCPAFTICDAQSFNQCDFSQECRMPLYAEEWKTEKIGPFHDYARRMVVRDGEVVVVGSKWTSWENTADLWLLKYDAYGNLLWEKQMPIGLMADGRDVVTDAEGNIFVVGSTTENCTGGDCPADTLKR